MFKNNKLFGFTCGVVFTVMFLAVFLAPLLSLISTRQELRTLTAQAAEMQQEIDAKDELISAYRAQTASVASILGQAAETLDNIAYGPYSREQIQAKVARVAEIIGEVNESLTPEEIEEISQAIAHSAVAADIDPMLLTAMAITESRCRPLARGGSGEYGLIQIMPSTGKWIAGKLGYTDWQPSDMLDVQMNVEFAAYYLWAVTKDMGGDTWTGVLAYNAGPTGAKKWLAGNDVESHDYVQKVMSTYQSLGGGTGA